MSVKSLGTSRVENWSNRRRGGILRDGFPISFPDICGFRNPAVRDAGALNSPR